MVCDLVVKEPTEYIAAMGRSARTKRAKNKEYYYKNRERLCAKGREYYHTHLDDRRAKGKEYYKTVAKSLKNKRTQEQKTRERELGIGTVCATWM